jgi:multisubunit Na+/H+ antiporter MnhG subunit
VLADIVIAVALVGACALALLSALGLAIARTTHDRLHFLSPPSLSAILIAIALWVDVGPSLLALKATLLALILVATTPVLAHVFSRATRINARGDWRWRPADGEVERG